MRLVSCYVFYSDKRLFTPKPWRLCRVSLGKGLGLVVRPLTEEWAERRMLLCVKKERSGNTSLAKLLDFPTARERRAF